MEHLISVFLFFATLSKYIFIFFGKKFVSSFDIFHPFFGRLINQSILLQMSELKFDVCMQLVVDCSKENNTFQNFSTVQVIT